VTANESMIDLWNGADTAAWSTHPARYDEMLEPFGTAALDAASITAGERVLDIGCGAGALTLAAAARAGDEGRATGADISRQLLALARRRAAEIGARNAQFIEADAQTHCFDDTVDVVVSRFGVMFFADPTAAFTNIRSAGRPGARLAFVCWQPLADNEWALTPVLTTMPHVGVPDAPGPEAPGPFAFGDRDRINGILGAAGWNDINIEPFATSIHVGGASTAEDAVAYYREDAFGKVLFGRADADAQAAAADALLHELRQYETPDGVRLGAATWIVTATRR
jgi:SAM-dependent methyltransferase